MDIDGASVVFLIFSCIIFPSTTEQCIASHMIAPMVRPTIEDPSVLSYGLWRLTTPVAASISVFSLEQYLQDGEIYSKMRTFEHINMPQRPV